MKSKCQSPTYTFNLERKTKERKGNLAEQNFQTSFFFISKNTNILDITSSTRGTVQNTHQHQDMRNMVSKLYIDQQK